MSTLDKNTRRGTCSSTKVVAKIPYSNEIHVEMGWKLEVVRAKEHIKYISSSWYLSSSLIQINLKFQPQANN